MGVAVVATETLIQWRSKRTMYRTLCGLTPNTCQANQPFCYTWRTCTARQRGQFFQKSLTKLNAYLEANLSVGHGLEDGENPIMDLTPPLQPSNNSPPSCCFPCSRMSNLLPLLLCLIPRQPLHSHLTSLQQSFLCQVPMPL